MGEHAQDDAEHLARAMKLAAKIAARIADTLHPLEREMELMRWPEDYRRIMWEGVARAALSKAKGDG